MTVVTNNTTPLSVKYPINIYTSSQLIALQWMIDPSAPRQHIPHIGQYAQRAKIVELHLHKKLLERPHIAVSVQVTNVI